MKTLVSSLSVLAFGLTLSACAAMKQHPGAACACHGGSEKSCDCGGTSKAQCDCGKGKMKGAEKAKKAKKPAAPEAAAPAAK